MRSRQGLKLCLCTMLATVIGLPCSGLAQLDDAVVKRIDASLHSDFRAIWVDKPEVACHPTQPLLRVAEGPFAVIPTGDSDCVPGPQAAGRLDLRVFPKSSAAFSVFVLNSNVSLEHLLARIEWSTPGLTASGVTTEIRAVKWWYQAGARMRVERPGPARLVPELLLNDPGLVRALPERRRNELREAKQLRDASTLLPQKLDAGRWTQFWGRITVGAAVRPGHYTGRLLITGRQGGGAFQAEVPVSLVVPPMTLKIVDSVRGIFYLGRPRPRGQPAFDARGKTADQFVSELRDLRQHGVNWITIDHDYSSDIEDGQLDWLDWTLSLIPQDVVSGGTFVYVDWHMYGADRPADYRRKLALLHELWDRYGLGDLWIYNFDERLASRLLHTRHTFVSAHEIGAKNIVALARTEGAVRLIDYLDAVVLQHDADTELIKTFRNAGRLVLAYGVPHAAEEYPEQTRWYYGIRPLLRGFSGVMSYAYQSGTCWDDWYFVDRGHYRPNVMAYPTVDRPIPTLQWEAFREAVQDLAVAMTYAKQQPVALEQVLTEWAGFFRRDDAFWMDAARREFERRLQPAARSATRGAAVRVAMRKTSDAFSSE